MTDGGSALHASYGVQVEYAHLLQCAIHFLKNVKMHAKRHNEIFKDSDFWALQKAETADRFNGILAELNAPRTKEYILSKDPSTWALHGWLRRGAVCYDRVTSNPSEQTHSAQLDIRRMSPYYFCIEYLRTLQRHFFELRECAAIMETRGVRAAPLTPFAMTVLCANREKARRLHVTPADNGMTWSVVDRTVGRNAPTFTVNSHARSCSCRGRTKIGLACAHEIAVWIEISGTDRRVLNDMPVNDEDFTEFCLSNHEYYRASTFIQSVRRVEIHLPDETRIVEDPLRLPPNDRATSRIKARKKKRRISSFGPGGQRFISARARRRRNAVRLLRPLDAGDHP